MNRRSPGVVETLGSLKGDFVLDGELVAFDLLNLDGSFW